MAPFCVKDGDVGVRLASGDLDRSKKAVDLRQWLGFRHPR
jgi:hypothetical protein